MYKWLLSAAVMAAFLLGCDSAAKSSDHQDWWIQIDGQGEITAPNVYHDLKRQVTCWEQSERLACLPDRQISHDLYPPLGEKQ